MGGWVGVRCFWWVPNGFQGLSILQALGGLESRGVMVALQPPNLTS